MAQGDCSPGEVVSASALGKWPHAPLAPASPPSGFLSYLPSRSAETWGAEPRPGLGALLLPLASAPPLSP